MIEKLLLFMLLTILKEPDPRLRRISAEVEVFDSNLEILVERMFYTMKHASGIGLAAPQVDVLQRIVVMNVHQQIALINPLIIESAKDITPYEEGCLSIPGYHAVVKRPTHVNVRFYDIHQQCHTVQFSGLEATCIQHEIDHLNGVLFIDHLSMLKKNMFFQKRKKSV